MNQQLLVKFFEVGLSRRQAEVAELALAGLTNSKIGEVLFVNEKTVKFHIGLIYKKLDLKSRAQFMCWAFNNLTPKEVIIHVMAPKAEPVVEKSNSSPDELPSGEQNRPIQLQSNR